MEIARVLIYGDPHLSVRDYGMHNDYSKESLDCFHKITEAAIDNKVTHLIGLGDFTYGKFTKLEYRVQVENELDTQYKLVNGNHYMLKGNHDTAGYGMTEYEYYLQKGKIKGATNFDIGNVHFTLVDFDKHMEVTPNISMNKGDTNILLAHDYFGAEGVWIPGNPIDIASMKQWYGVDHMIIGHIHNQKLFKASIIKEIDGMPTSHNLTVHYPGSLARPSYQEGHMDLVGQLVLLVIYDTGDIDYKILDIELLPIEEAFNLAIKDEQKEREDRKERRKVDIADIVQSLALHETDTGNPEDIVSGLENVDKRYKDKAIELLKKAVL